MESNYTLNHAIQDFFIAFYLKQDKKREKKHDIIFFVGFFAVLIVVILLLARRENPLLSIFSTDSPRDDLCSKLKQKIQTIDKYLPNGPPTTRIYLEHKNSEACRQELCNEHFRLLLKLLEKFEEYFPNKRNCAKNAMVEFYKKAVDCYYTHYAYVLNLPPGMEAMQVVVFRRETKLMNLMEKLKDKNLKDLSEEEIREFTTEYTQIEIPD